ncbi:hypothetical protein [Agriterribacter sp.]|uniref:hypothetical protein n=1 Tax=Agriterribacter sp. TaxID=2821509 RepID=UPI002CE7A679|nr:hypothetical protein [Agriterribacter sp.]HTN09043.1 hypothetical protein [Agriterribacter sp.]
MRFGLRYILKSHAFLFILFSFSCNKEIEEDAAPPFTITGEWIFMSNTVSTEAITTYTVDNIVYRNKITANYITYNNEGTVTIAGNNMKGSGVRFDVITKAYFSFYIGDDTDEDSVETPFTSYMDSAYGTQQPFQLIGKDSIYFPAGTLMAIPDINGEERTSMTLPQGGTVRGFDHSMKIITHSVDEYSYTEDGTTYHVVKKESVETDLAKPF